jgi:hypothetical protein
MDDPGALTILFEVKSSTDKNANLVAGAQMILGAAAVFTTGGAATTVAGLTSAMAKPAFATVEQKVDKGLGVAVLGQARVDLDWPAVRKGIRSIVVPVYLSETNWGETPADAISRIQKTAMPSAAKLFDIVLSFSYTKTLFDTRVASATGLPAGDALASLSVLNYPRLPGIQNFMQILNASSPSLLQAVASAKTNLEKAAAASQAMEALRDVGLNLMDRAVVMKSFVDEAHKGPGWYSQPEVYSYFSGFPDLRDQIFRIYGDNPIEMGIYDTQLGYGAPFNGWKGKVAPILADLRQALTTTEARAGALSNFNGGADFDLSFYPSSAGWLPAPAPAPNPGDPAPSTTIGPGPADAPISYPPGITRLASNSVRKAGCFVYGEPMNLDPNTMGGHMIVISEKGDTWRLDAELAHKGSGKIGKITLARMNDDWKNFFKKVAYGGGECPGILSSL